MMKTFPIAAAAADLGTADGHDDPIPRSTQPLTRRELLRGSGLLMGTLAAGPLLAIAPSSAWALELKALSTAQGTTLMQMGRVLYPHARLPDAVYALLVKDLDAGAAADAGTARLLSDGLEALHLAAGGDFGQAKPARRLEAVKAIEGQPFFNKVRGQCITSLYDNEMAYAVFGYPGSAWEKGGYITRGFQDLKWLPAPSLAASPKPYL
ncbi:MAG: tat (twin-arginine translocation) pathway signal sequence [Leptothrix sp. (in: b-proteobacteria)]